MNLATLNETDPTEDALFGAGSDFYSNVLHRIQGNRPFLFSPNSTSSALDNFAICTMDMKEFKFKQVANGVYNMKLKIREVW